MVIAVTERGKTDLTKALARNIVETRYDDLPVEAREATKRSILDTIGVMLPPTTLDKSCIAIYELVKEAEGKEECTLIGFGGKAPCWMAAFVNGSLCHAIDFDDTVDELPYHPTAPLFPAALAVAERKGGVSGQDLIAAVALGSDFGTRMASAPTGKILDRPFSPMTVFGVMGAAAAAGKVQSLSEDEMVNCLGLAFHRVAGITEAMAAPGSDLRGIRDGFSNKEGAVAALLAGKGVATCKDPIERLFETYYRGEYDPRPLTQNLGKRYRGIETSIKPWPACRQTHGYIQTAFAIMKQHDIESHQIDEVILTVSRSVGEHQCEPAEEKRNPASSIAAKRSVPFVAAVALAKGSVQIGHFLPQNLKDPDVLRMAQRITHKVDPTFGVVTPCPIEIRTKNGQSYSSRAGTLRGHPDNPLSKEELVEKFRDCARYGRARLSSSQIERLIAAILDLETVKDVRQISDILEGV